MADVAANGTVIGGGRGSEVSALYGMGTSHWFPLLTRSGKADGGEEGMCWQLGF
jgi:hypothetical protein